MSENANTLDDILARKQQAVAAVVNVDEPITKLVFFSLGEQWYAFHGENISEVLASSEVYFLPGCPASLEGVINVRGDIESVIRLRPLLGLPDVKAAAGSRILLGQARAMRSGIRVDRVEEVLDVLESAIQPPPHTIPEHLRPIVLGIVSFRDHLVHLLDLERIFEDYRAGLR
ncbi:MAG: chemotaxis protein CheW [Formivibrio sp.]|nr:chemotaxis protein CheW [Formivibrio sp.]